MYLSKKKKSKNKKVNVLCKYNKTKKIGKGTVPEQTHQRMSQCHKILSLQNSPVNTDHIQVLHVLVIKQLFALHRWVSGLGNTTLWCKHALCNHFILLILHFTDASWCFVFLFFFAISDEFWRSSPLSPQLVSFTFKCEVSEMTLLLEVKWNILGL